MALLCSCLRAQTAAHPFRFAQPDEKLLEEANELDRQFEKKGLTYHDVRAEEYLENIGQGLLRGAPAPERVAYQFHILRDPMVNAFALPNGSLYVNTGLLAAMENEAELASVMAHEITHVTGRHTYLQNRSIRKKAVTMEVIAGVAGAAGYFPVGALFGSTIVFVSQVSQVLIISSIFGYSQDLEREADSTGYSRLIDAGYDGEAMTQALELLDEKLEFEPVEPFWRTHPKLQERIATAENLARTKNEVNPRVVSENDYLDHVAPVIRYNVTLDLDSRRPRTAVARAERLVKWAPGDAVNRTLLADAYRSLGAKTPQADEDELTRRGKATARKQILKLTAEEEQKTLLATPAGTSTLEANRTRAEALYREAAAIDPQLPDPHRGLGMLYQDQNKYSDAAREYRRYLDLALPQVVDRLRIERRLEALKRTTEHAGDKP
jgi:predicted Zn-dependent protease